MQEGWWDKLKTFKKEIITCARSCLTQSSFFSATTPLEKKNNWVFFSPLVFAEARLFHYTVWNFRKKILFKFTRRKESIKGSEKLCSREKRAKNVHARILNSKAPTGQRPIQYYCGKKAAPVLCSFCSSRLFSSRAVQCPRKGKPICNLMRVIFLHSYQVREKTYNSFSRVYSLLFLLFFSNLRLLKKENSAKIYVTKFFVICVTGKIGVHLS